MKNQSQRRQHKPKSAAIRQRITPTFYHHNIFNQDQLSSHRERVTPTFVSSVFDTQGYHIITNHSRVINKKQPNTESQEHVYNNISRQKKIASLYPCTNVGVQSRYGNNSNVDYKEQIAKEINFAGGKTSRMRKCLEQMSNPIFGGYVWEPNLGTCQNVVNQKLNIKNQQQKQESLHLNNNNKKTVETPTILHNRSENILKPSLKQERQEVLQRQVVEQKKINLQKGDPRKKAPNFDNKKANPKHQNNLKKLKSTPKLCTHKH